MTRFRDRVRIRARWAWRVWEQSSGVVLLPGLSIFAGINVVAMILVRQAWQGWLTFGSGMLLFTTAFLASLAVFGRMLLDHPAGSKLLRRGNLFLGAATALPGLALASGFGLRTPLGAFFSAVVMLTTSAVVVCWNQPRFRSGVARLGRAARQLFGSQSQDNEIMDDVGSRLPIRSRRHSSESASDMHPIQWMQRAVDSRGAERLEGVMRVDFPAGQSTVTVHVAFCPPFQRTPAFQCRVPETPTVRVRASVAYPYGARVELKRIGANSDPQSIELEFDAQSAIELSRAA